VENFLKSHTICGRVVERILKSLIIHKAIVENFHKQCGELGKSCGKLSEKSDNSNK